MSAAFRSAAKSNHELVAAAEAALRRHFPAMAEARITRALVQREPSATFASTPELEALRPGPVTPIAGFYLAGDWTATGLPATIEGAVRSGERAAQAVLSSAHSWSRSSRATSRRRSYRAVTSGNDRQTGTPQKCSPSVQMGADEAVADHAGRAHVADEPRVQRAHLLPARPSTRGRSPPAR